MLLNKIYEGNFLLLAERSEMIYFNLYNQLQKFFSGQFFLVYFRWYYYDFRWYYCREYYLLSCKKYLWLVKEYFLWDTKNLSILHQLNLMSLRDDKLICSYWNLPWKLFLFSSILLQPLIKHLETLLNFKIVSVHKWNWTRLLPPKVDCTSYLSSFQPS